MLLVIDLIGEHRRVPINYEQCLSLWCAKCLYFYERKDECISQYKREKSQL